MKCTKFIVIAALNLGLSSSMIFSSETPNTGLTHWAQNQFSSFYKGMINSFPIVLHIPQSIAATVSEWNDRTKIIISTTIMASFLTIYKRKEIAEWIGDLIVKPTDKTKRERTQFTEMPWGEDYKKKAAEWRNK